jgi:hypothetical protein
VNIQQPLAESAFSYDTISELNVQQYYHPKLLYNLPRDTAPVAFITLVARTSPGCGWRNQPPDTEGKVEVKVKSTLEQAMKARGGWAE